MPVSLVVPRVVAERVRRMAERLGVSVEEYLLELVTEGLDPEDRAAEYVKAARELLEGAREALSRGDLRQAAEKAWGAAALAIKAYAYWRDGKRLKSHRELWEYKDVVVRQLGEWVRDSWAHANSMHVCFYEGWCTKVDVEVALKAVERLVEAIAGRVLGGRRNTTCERLKGSL